MHVFGLKYIIQGIMRDSEKHLYEILSKLDINNYQVHEHQAIFTTEEAEKFGLVMPGLNMKNLLIKDKRKEKFFMVILEDHHHMDQKVFKELTHWGKIRFAHEEEMWELLKLKPGSVSPFGLINDIEKRVTVVLEKAITRTSDEEQMNFHPNRNTATLSLKKKDFMRYLEYLGNEIIQEK